MLRVLFLLARFPALELEKSNAGVIFIYPGKSPSLPLSFLGA
ncbi:hypothetical protein FEM08_12390 [Flavobacterium gilvum]|nr:hypothetical protein FEM08_12390 [Flavobacterium gilvum]